MWVGRAQMGERWRLPPRLWEEAVQPPKMACGSASASSVWAPCPLALSSTFPADAQAGENGVDVWLSSVLPGSQVEGNDHLGQGQFIGRLDYTASNNWGNNMDFLPV